LRLASESSENATIICDYITAEQIEMNIKESTKEGKIKCLVWLSSFHSHKSFNSMTKQEILNYLNSLRRPEAVDSTHKWIGSYNARQMIFLKFFRWLYNQEELDVTKRITPPCMQGVKRLTRKEKSPYKPSDLWTDEEHELFLKYCPSNRDKAFHAMANDTSARPHELLNLKIKDIVFKRAANGIQYAEVLVCGKTKSRTLPLISSIPYVKEWLREHPLRNNPEAWLFISFSKLNKLGQLTRDGLLKKYAEYYRDRYFRGLIVNPAVSERDKAYLKNLFTKPWNLYIFRHSALTQKSQILKEHILRDHAGWSPTSHMPEVYLHYFGTESSTTLLEAHGIIKTDKVKKDLLTPIHCPSCKESNKPDERFCISCKMVLKYDAYEQTLDEKQQRQTEIGLLEKNTKDI
jgi:integrase